MSYKNVYLVGTGSFFPGEPVNNDEIDGYIKPVNSKSDRIKKMILRDNGIKSRYYGIDQEGQTVFSSSSMAARSITQSLEKAGKTLDDIELLTAGTCAGDAFVPGFANMIQAELKAKPMETSSHTGICASGIQALRYASDAIETGRVSNAVVNATEFPSRLFKHTRFVEGYDVDMDSHFLRWMLSDGSGSFVLSDQPHEKNVSFKLKDIHLKSHSGDYAACMYIGHPIDDHSKSALDYPSWAEAEKNGALLLRQNVRMLPQLFEMCLHEYASLVNKGFFNPSKIDHFVTHYSSGKFRGVMKDLLNKLDIMIPEEKWFSNLENRGNMGAASIFTMLDDLLAEKDVKPGEEVLLFIPESGRFSCGFVLLEAVPPGEVEILDKKEETTEDLISKAIPPADLHLSQTDNLRKLLLNLSDVWHDFRSRVWRTPYFSKITRNELTIDDYLTWQENWIPQVREGSKWMRKAVSNLEAPFLDIKELIEHHAQEEQNDWKILFDDYRRAGGAIDDADKLNLNDGGKRLNDFMYSRANTANAVDLLGGMYIIEGTGQRIVPTMLPLVRKQLQLPANCFNFLKYHSVNDQHHIEEWLGTVEIVLSFDETGEYADKIIETAKTVADNYCKQMEEIFK